MAFDHFGGWIRACFLITLDHRFRSFQCVDQSMIADHFRLSFSVMSVCGSEHDFQLGFRRYGPAMMDAFQKVWAGRDVSRKALKI